MTDEKAEAESDAEWLLLLLLLYVGRPDTPKRVTFKLGRFYVDDVSVSINRIRSFVLRTERRLSRRVGQLVDDLDSGKIDADAWEKEFNRNITSGHIIAGALALGGIAKAIDNRIVRRRLDIERKYAERFAGQIRRGEAGSPQAIRSRARSYLRSISITYGQVELATQKALGFRKECRRIRRASESCRGCRRWSYRWMPIEQMPPIGTLDCGGNCRCYLEYR